MIDTSSGRTVAAIELGAERERELSRALQRQGDLLVGWPARRIPMALFERPPADLLVVPVGRRIPGWIPALELTRGAVSGWAAVPRLFLLDIGAGGNAKLLSGWCDALVADDTPVEELVRYIDALCGRSATDSRSGAMSSATRSRNQVIETTERRFMAAGQVAG